MTARISLWDPGCTALITGAIFQPDRCANPLISGKPVSTDYKIDDMLFLMERFTVLDISGDVGLTAFGGSQLRIEKKDERWDISVIFDI